MFINESGTVASRQKVELKKAFSSAKSLNQMLKAFKKMEPFLEEIDLGMECMVLAYRLYDQEDIQETLRFGKKALKILLANVDKEKPCFGKYTRSTPYKNCCTNCQTPAYFISSVCNLLGSACLKLKRYDESGSYLNWADRNFTTLKAGANISLCVGNCVLYGLIDTQLHLVAVKTAQGKMGESAAHMIKVLEFKEKLLKEASIELGEAYMDTCNACCSANDFRTALPLCLKALDIHEKHLGRNSDVVGNIRKTLGVIYQAIGEHEKALDQNLLSLSVLKDTGTKSYDLLMYMGRNEEAVVVLEKEVLRDDVDGEQRVLAILALAKALVTLEKIGDAKKHMKAAKNILEKKGTKPYVAAAGFGLLSCLYEELNDPETALSYIRRAVAVPGISQSFLTDYSSRLFSFTFRSSKLKEGIPYLEDVVKKLEDSFGTEHYEVGHGYANLGIAYWKSGQEELGVRFMTNGKDILDATLGPNHVYSLKTSQTLSATYASMGRYTQAIDLQEKVVEGLKGQGSSVQEFVDEAVMLLNDMKEGAAESHTSDSPLFEDNEDICATISKCAISDPPGKEN